jgi:hypothetical protein
MLFEGMDMEPNGIPGLNGSRGNPMEWWDISFAKMFNDRPVGINLSWAKDMDKFTNSDGDVTNDTKTSMIGLQVGTTLDFADVAAEVSFGSYKDETPTDNGGPDPQDFNDYSFFNFALAARGDLEDVGGIDWRWIGAFSSGSSEPKMTDAVKRSTTAFRGSFGPVYGTPGEWEVAGYVSLDYVKHESRGDAVDLLDTDKWFSFPAYNVAMEYYLNDWFVFRAGASSHNASDTTTSEQDPGESEDKERNYEFMWTMGLGIDKGAWGIDLALDEDSVHSGYLPFTADNSGNDNIALLTAWLDW